MAKEYQETIKEVREKMDIISQAIRDLESATKALQMLMIHDNKNKMVEITFCVQTSAKPHCASIMMGPGVLARILNEEIGRADNLLQAFTVWADIKEWLPENMDRGPKDDD